MVEDEDGGEAESAVEHQVVAAPDSVLKTMVHKTLVQTAAYHPPIHEWQLANFEWQLANFK